MESAGKAAHSAADGIWKSFVLYAVLPSSGWAGVTTYIKQIAGNTMSWEMAFAAAAAVVVPLFLAAMYYRQNKGTKRDLAATKGDLANTQAALAQTQEILVETRNDLDQLRHQPQVAPARNPAAESAAPPTLFTQHGPMRLKGIGVVGIPSFTFKQQGNDWKFDCTCTIRFHGVGDTGADASPSELRLTSPREGAELALLQAERVLGIPNTIIYSGSGKWTYLMECVEATMEGIRCGGPLKPWQGVPASRGLFCRVELRLPKGRARTDHDKSGIKLDFELEGDNKRSMVVSVT